MKTFAQLTEQLKSTFLLHMATPTVLSIRNGKHRIEVRGKVPYGVKHVPSDPLHKFMDSLDPATVANLMADIEVPLNPKNSRTKPSLMAAEKLFRNTP